ncbi:methyl-accepting chemotaxis protein [Pantoea sp. App145]|uniref:methyl-accepting chemotaxis protein n=1 Tax=Pantoea sp. App145 TaxID=3071567 RepID=UPI003A80C216
MFKTLRGRLIAVSVVITALSLIALAAFTYTTVRGQTLRSIDERIGQLSRVHAAELSGWAAEKQRITGSIKTAFGRHEDAVPFLNAAIEAGAFDDAYIVYREPHSHVFVHPMPATYDGSQRPWYLATVKAGHPLLLDPYVDASTGKLTITFAQPVIKNGETLGVVGSDMHLDTVSDTVGAIHPLAKSFAFLVDSSGRLIAAPQSEVILKSLSELSPSLNLNIVHKLAGNGGHAELAINGEQQFIYASPVKGTTWSLVIAVDRNEVTASLSALQRTTLLITLVSLVITALIVGLVVNRQLRRLGTLRDALEDVASGEGDLTRRLDVRGGDELAQISAAFNRFVGKLSGVLLRVREGANNISLASTEISSGNNDLASRTEEQAAGVVETAATLEELTSTFSNTASNTEQARQFISGVAAAVRDNGTVMNDVSSRIQEISNDSMKMSEIIKVIDSIAFQTNILALNAAVEAARAGESGRGFAVVASEVRNLAQRSAGAAREIKTLIDDTVARVASGRELVVKADRGMADIVSDIQSMTQLIDEIAQASREQSDSIGQINIAMGQIDTTTQQNAALVEESASAAQSMSEQAVLMAELVSSFKLMDNAAAMVVHPEMKEKNQVLSLSTSQPELAITGTSIGDNWRSF